MKFLTERDKAVVEAMRSAINSCVLLDRVRTAPPGRAIECLPQHIRDKLKMLKSEDLNNIRPDLAARGWL